MIYRDKAGNTHRIIEDYYGCRDKIIAPSGRWWTSVWCERWQVGAQSTLDKKAARYGWEKVEDSK